MERVADNKEAEVARLADELQLVQKALPTDEAANMCVCALPAQRLAATP